MTHQLGTYRPTGTDELEAPDSLFDAIRNRNPVEVREILGVYPFLVNCFNRKRQKKPQELFDEERYEYLLTQDVLRRNVHDGIVVTERCDQRPLHMACMIGDYKTVEALLEQKYIEPELENGSRETSFSIACRSANLPIAKLLLEKSFRLTWGMVDNTYNTPVDYLVHRGIYPEWSENPPKDQSEVFAELTTKITSMDGFNDEKSKMLLLRCVVAEGNMPMLNALWKGPCRECDLDATEEEGWTLLHLAASCGHMDMVKWLLNAGADPDARTILPDQMDAGEVAMEFLHDPDAAQNVRDEITAAQSLRDWKPKKNYHSKDRCSKWMSQTGAERQELRMNQSTIDELIRDHGSIDQPPFQGETVWCHLHANSEQWVKDLCRGFSKHDSPRCREYLGYIQSALNFACRIPLDRWRLAEAFQLRDRKGKSGIALVIPMIDIDILEPGFTATRMSSKTPCSLTTENVAASQEDHIQSMHDFHTKSELGLHCARTLDGYADADLRGTPLEKYNLDQVLSRWFEKYENQKNHVRPHISSSHQQRATNVASRLQGWFRTAMREASLTADTPVSDVESQRNLRMSKISKRIILVVSQLWLFKCGDTLIASYPQRWDSSPGHEQFLDLLRRKVTKRAGQKFTSELLFHKVLEESMKFQARIPSNMLGPDNPSISEISDTTSGSSAPTSPDQDKAGAASYLEIFSREVIRIWRDVDAVFYDFKMGQFEANEKFAEYTARATEFLLNLDDLLGEIGKIKGVLEYQLSIWNELHAADDSQTKPPPPGTSDEGDATNLRQTPLGDKCVWDSGCKPDRFREILFKHGMFRSADKIQQDAKTLRDKVCHNDVHPLGTQDFDLEHMN